MVASGAKIRELKTSRPVEVKPAYFRNDCSSYSLALVTTMEMTMNFKLLAAATVLSTAIAAPALAQDPAPRAHAVKNATGPGARLSS
jgi:hypothetical protein